jgi:hypothetical protein
MAKRKRIPEVQPWRPPAWLESDLIGDPADRTANDGDTTEAKTIPGIGTWARSELTIRPVRGDQATKQYVCPLCNQSIPIRTPHTVVIPDAATDHRRHFHTACWRRFDTGR